MKYYKLFFISLFITLIPSSVLADIYTAPNNGVKYRFSVGKSEAAVANGNYGISGGVSLLSKFTVNGNEYTVTNIEDYAFYANEQLTSVYIPATVTSIGDCAFSDCVNLTRVTIPENVTYIGSDAFSFCIKLSTINLPNGLTRIQNGTFEGCESLKSISIPSSVTSIEGMAFQQSGVTSISIPSSVEKIDYQAFAFCEQLKKVTINNGVTTIGEGAFAQCNTLASITIPKSVTTIEEHIFSGCSSLSTMTIQCKTIGSWMKDVTALKTLTLGTDVTTVSSDAFSACTNLNSVEFHCKNFDTWFKGNKSLSYVIIGEEVESGTQKAFAGCTKLTAAAIRCPSIGQWFRENTNIKSLVIGEKVSKISDYAFYGCKGLTTLEIPNSVGSIGKYVFSGCTSLTAVTLPNKLEWIENNTFENCSKLISIIIPNTVKSIGAFAFSGCSSLANFTLPNSVTSIGDNAFQNCVGLTSITIPNSIINIRPQSFAYCSNLASVEFHCSKIQEWFSNMLSIKSIIIGKEVEYIHDDAFAGCDNLVSLEIHTSKIENQFEGKEKLSKVILGNELTTIGSYAFKECISLKTIDIPNSVTSIGGGAFEASGLTSITLPNSINKIDTYTFYGCKDLTTVTIPECVTTIKSSAFSNSGLTSITIPNSIKTIDYSTFAYCKNLSSITIPNSVELICNNAFEGCTSLNSIVLGSGITNIQSEAFRNCGSQMEITFHCEVIGRWFSANPSLKNIIIADEVKTILNGAFYNCSLLESVRIGKNVIDIGDNPFTACDSLESIIICEDNNVYDSRNNCNAIIKTSTNTLIAGCKTSTIPSSVLKLGYQAFYANKGLTSIRIPNTVKSIGSRAFMDCEKLEKVSISYLSPNDVSLGSDCFYRISGNATLVVPKGRKSAFEASAQWKNTFAQIIEDENTSTLVDFEQDGNLYHGDYYDRIAVLISGGSGTSEYVVPSSVTNNGISYTIIGIEDNAINGDFDYIEIPNTIQSIGSKALSGCKAKAIIWNADFKLPAEVINNSKINKNGNSLLFIKKEAYNPGNMRNVVVDKIAETITLTDDGGEFYCPQLYAENYRPITANKISYTRNFTMPTVKGTCQGWETLTIPFDVQEIVHETRGDLIPMTRYDRSSDLHPFWLYELSHLGFIEASDIQANKPYLISMPNDANAYDEEYLLKGKVTFSATNVTVKDSKSIWIITDSNTSFIPTFSNVSKTDGIYALNVNNDYVQSANGLAPGSCFINNLREVRPFEAYITHSVGAREVIDIHFADDVTDIIDIASYNGKNSANTIYTLSGMKIATVSESELKQTLNALPCGIYIVDGKKLIKQ